jgi:basic membrane lipoprotein Med (substrate-binding protein (PBP1-ABC) superfamily)
VERVEPSSALAAFERLAGEEGCGIVYSCAWEFADQIAQASRKYPSVVFQSLGGNYDEKADPNLGTCEINEMPSLYLAGLVAGAMSSSGKIGHLTEAPTNEPWYPQMINNFTLGVKAANPRATVILGILPRNHWEARDTQLAAARSLLAQGCDFLWGVNSPEIAELLGASTMAGKRALMFMTDLSYKPWQNVVVSGPLRDFEVVLEKSLLDFKDGNWKKEFYAPAASGKFGGGEQAFNPIFLAELRGKKVKTPDLGTVGLLDLAEKRYAQILAGEFDPFTGPVKDQKGKTRIPSGVRAGSDWKFMNAMDWLVDNVKTGK